MKKLFSAAAVVVGVWAGNAQAAGFQLDVQSGKSVGMAGAVTASVDDASGVFFNPAGIARGPHYDLELGDTLLIPTFTYTDGAGNSASTKGEVVPPPHVYASYGITDDLSLGIGEFSEYGSALTWPDDFVGRYLVKSVSLQTFNLNPTIAFRVAGRVRVGLGVQIVRSTVELTQSINFLDGQDGTADIVGSAWGAGGNLGVQVDVLDNDRLTLGAHFRSAVDLNFSNGRAHFSDVPLEFQNKVLDQSGSTEIRLPETLQLGVAFRPVDKLQVTFDADYTAWQRNNAIVLTFTDPDLSQSIPKNWHHTWNFQLGAEYLVTDAVAVRAGFKYDPTPSPSDTVSPDLPDSTRMNFCIGGGYKTGNFRADLGYQLVVITSEDVTTPVLPGSYKGLAHVLSLTLAYGK